MRKLMMAALGALMVLTFKPEAAEASTAVAVVDLNIRSGPSARHHRLGVIPAGAAVHVYQCARGWCRINYRGIVGHASARYLDSAVAYAPRRQTYYQYGYVVPQIVVPSPRYHSRVYRPHRAYRHRFHRPHRGAYRPRHFSPRQHHWQHGSRGGMGYGGPGSGR